MRRGAFAWTAGVLVLSACGSTSLAVDPIFIEGRSVASAGDSVIAVTRAGAPGILVRRRRGTEVRTLGANSVKSPVHIQWATGQWYVSDVENGKPFVVALGPDGQERRRISLERHTSTPHQFAVLPDGRIVVESAEGALVALDGDSSSVFTVTDRTAKTGLLVAASGGVLHAVPDRYITLYNQFGHIRWRLEWPWAKTAYISEIAVDPQNRIHALAGVPSDSTFIVYSLSNNSGEIVIWSPASHSATFIVDRLGQIKPDAGKKWFR
jgi:hypothetical protein